MSGRQLQEQLPAPYLPAVSEAWQHADGFVEATLYPQIELSDRLRTIRDIHGFMPTSKTEINGAFGLLPFMETPGGAAKHLNEILLHQKKARTDTPDAAVRSVTREYAGYAAKARADGSNLVYLRQELADLDDASNLKTLQSVGIQTGLPQFVRYYDLSRLANDGTVVVSPFTKRSDGKASALDPYTAPQPTKEMKLHMDKVAATTRVWDARKVVEGMISDQHNRFGFWTARLREARAHTLAAPVATAALQQLKVPIGR